MERALVGTVAIAVVASMVAAPFFLSRGIEEHVTVLKNEFPTILAVATSDSLGENAFEYGLIANRDCPFIEIGYRFLYGENLTLSRAEKIEVALNRINTLREMSMLSDGQIVRTGLTNYNRSEVNYTLWDFTPSPLIPAGSNLSTFLILGSGSEILACFSGAADLHPGRLAGGLIEMTVTRSGDRQHYSRHASENAGSLPIDSSPGIPLRFDSVKKDETITIAFRSDARHIEPRGGGAVQVVLVRWGTSEETTVFNFMK